MPLAFCAFAWRAAGFDAVSEAIGFLSLISLFFAWMLFWLRWREFFFTLMKVGAEDHDGEIGIGDIGALQILSHKNSTRKDLIILLSLIWCLMMQRA